MVRINYQYIYTTDNGEKERIEGKKHHEGGINKYNHHHHPAVYDRDCDKEHDRAF